MTPPRKLPGRRLFRLPVDLGKTARLVKDTVHDTFEDRLPGLAAEVAFYLVLSLPPLLLVILGLLGYIGDLAGAETAADIKAELLDWVDNFFAASTIEESIEPAIDELLARGRADILTVGGIIALWSGSRAARVIVDAVTIAYDLEDQRIGKLHPDHEWGDGT